MSKNTSTKKESMMMSERLTTKDLDELLRLRRDWEWHTADRRRVMVLVEDFDALLATLAAERAENERLRERLLAKPGLPA